MIHIHDPHNYLHVARLHADELGETLGADLRKGNIAADEITEMLDRILDLAPLYDKEEIVSHLIERWGEYRAG